MAQIFGKSMGFTGLAGLVALAVGQGAVAQTVVDRIAFRVPGVVVAWKGVGPPRTAAAMALAPDPAGCIAFASNTAVDVALETADDTLALEIVATGRSARPLAAVTMPPFRQHRFTERTAIQPDAARHQALTLCVRPQDDIPATALPGDIRIKLRAIG